MRGHFTLAKLLGAVAGEGAENSRRLTLAWAGGSATGQLVDVEGVVLLTVRRVPC